MLPGATSSEELENLFLGSRMWLVAGGRRSSPWGPLHRAHRTWQLASPRVSNGDRDWNWGSRTCAHTAVPTSFLFCHCCDSLEDKTKDKDSTAIGTARPYPSLVALRRPSWEWLCRASGWQGLFCSLPLPPGKETAQVSVAILVFNCLPVQEWWGHAGVSWSSPRTAGKASSVLLEQGFTSRQHTVLRTTCFASQLLLEESGALGSDRGGLLSSAWMFEEQSADSVPPPYKNNSLLCWTIAHFFPFKNWSLYT